MSKIEKTDAQWREELGPERYAVLRKSATERPFSGKLYKNDEDGTYRCGACGIELFGSEHKYDSGCGWPSFYDSEHAKNIELVEDRSHGMVRTETRCANCGSHLGHLFDDGPNPTGQRYCINSLALDFQKQER